MLTNLPDSVVIIFLLTVILTFLLFVNAVKHKATAAIVLVVWLAVTGILSFKEVFQNTSTIPPRLMIGYSPGDPFYYFIISYEKREKIYRQH
jgi:hypothetical protein